MNYYDFHVREKPVRAIYFFNITYLAGKWTKNLNEKAWMAACHKRHAAANWLLN